MKRRSCLPQPQPKRVVGSEAQERVPPRASLKPCEMLPGRVRNSFGGIDRYETAPLRSRLCKLLQACDTRYRAATAKARLRGSIRGNPRIG
jgi:hypothetical protein